MIVCGDPGTPDNGATSVTDTTIGSLANHTCDDGYLLEGAIQRVCLQMAPGHLTYQLADVS